MRVKTEIKNLEHTLYSIALKKGTILALICHFLQRNEGVSEICTNLHTNLNKICVPIVSF